MVQVSDAATDAKQCPASSQYGICSDHIVEELMRPYEQNTCTETIHGLLEYHNDFMTMRQNILFTCQLRRIELVDNIVIEASAS